MLKLCQFTVVHDLADRNLPDHSLVFNTATRSCLVVKSADWDRIVAALPATEPELVLPSVQRAVSQLRATGFVVDSGRDERAAWGRDFDSMRYGRRSLFPLIAVTTACNNGCTCCYEEAVAYET